MEPLRSHIKNFKHNLIKEYLNDLTFVSNCYIFNILCKNSIILLFFMFIEMIRSIFEA